MNLESENAARDKIIRRIYENRKERKGVLLAGYNEELDFLVSGNNIAMPNEIFKGTVTIRDAMSKKLNGFIMMIVIPILATIIFMQSDIKSNVLYVSLAFILFGIIYAVKKF